MSEHRVPNFAPSPEEHAAHARRSSGDSAILVADDDPSVRKFLRMFFATRGQSVWLASNGAEATELFLSHSREIGVVLLDIQMPMMDGPHAFERIHSINPHLPIWFMTGGSGSYDPQELVLRGAQGVLSKPFRIDDLVGVLLEHRSKLAIACPSPIRDGQECGGC
jgi:CheY-like chemotaxis protein